MKVIADTNVLIRSVIRDDPSQAAAAAKTLEEASLIAITLPCLCEFVWVLRSVYEFERSKIIMAIQNLIAAANVAVDRPAVEAGLALFAAGGDFADGVIAHEGYWLGGATFVSFDKKAVALLNNQGIPAQLPS